MGKDDEIGQLKPVKCNYGACQKRYDTEKEMKKHKKYDPDHFYCYKCDVDCKDWEDLTQHKIDAMQPWVDGRMRDNKDVSPKHIVCEFCGADFESFGGRRIHRDQNHQAQQNLPCPGCKRIFFSGGSMLAHFERNECEGQGPMKRGAIKADEFLSSVQKKHVAAKIMESGAGEIRQRLEDNKASQGLILDYRSETQEAETGGVALLDREDDDQKLGLEPLEAEVSLIDMKERANRTSSKLAQWPFLPGQGPKVMKDSSRRASQSSEISASQYANRITSRSGGPKMNTESYPPLGSSDYGTPLKGSSTTSSIANTTPPTSPNGPMAWSTGETSKALFAQPQSQPKPGDWDGIIAKRQEAAAGDDSTTNLLDSRWWDPTSKDYNAQGFFDHFMERYCCPFEGCDDAEYDDLNDLEGHMKYAHLRVDYTCPLCFKRFPKASALMSHAESAGGKCKVAKSSKYHQFLDQVSGGFLKAEYKAQPKIARGKTREQGLKGIEYEAQRPIKW